MDETAQKTGLRYRTEFNVWIIEMFFMVVACLMFGAIAKGLNVTKNDVLDELSRYSPTNKETIPTINVPFTENGPNLALAEGDTR